MTSYYKYTSGEAFTFNDNLDYVGFFHMTDGVPYTGKIDTVDMEQLIPKATFMSKFYMDLGTFNTVYTHIEQLTHYFTNVFDILNKQGLDTALEALDDGNLAVFKGGVLANPTVYNVEENSSFFYGLTSTSDLLKGKNNNVSVLPFSSNAYWSFLDDINDGDFTVNINDDFKYFCTDGTTLYLLSGNFLAPSKVLGKSTVITLSSPENVDYLYSIHHDVDAQQMFFVQSDVINIYDMSSYDDCGNLLLLDRIDLTPVESTLHIWNLLSTVKWEDANFGYDTKYTFLDPLNPDYSFQNPNSPQSIKFGFNIRTSLSGNVLTILNKHSSEVLNTISLAPYNVTEVLSIDARNSDDNVLVLYKQLSSIRLLHIDTTMEPISAVLSDTELKSIEVMDGFRVETSPTIVHIPNYTVKFSDVDSDMFYVYNTHEYQTRFISFPDYPAGRLESGNLLFPYPYIWNDADILWNFAFIVWNSGSLASNNPNILTSNEVIKNDKMYMLHHNIGRLYALHQPPPERFLNSIPLDIIANFNGTNCSESSFGLYFNNSISNIVKDTVNLFIKSYGKFLIHERYVDVQILENMSQLTNDLYLNGNETFNVLSLQRIFLLINSLQLQLIPESVEN